VAWMVSPDRSRLSELVSSYIGLDSSVVPCENGMQWIPN